MRRLGELARNMFALMVGSMLVRSYVLEFFGISLPTVRVGGGFSWPLWRGNFSTPMTRATNDEPH